MFVAMSAPAALNPAVPVAAGRSSPGVRAGPFVAAWGVFWLLLVAVAVQDHLRHGVGGWWQPVFWELSSCAVASALVAVLWPQLRRLDDRLAQPLQWLRWPLLLLPALALTFVGALYGLRHAVLAALGQTYRHAPWAEVLLYESIKFALFYLLFVALIFGLRSFGALQAERLRAEAGQRLAREAQLLQLAQQIEPHFLFNALNTIAAVLHDEPALAERLITRLATLLRTATDLARRPQVPLAEEIDLLRAYAEIMQARYGDRVQLQWDLDPAALPCRVPALLLQPLLENAYRHGAERHPGPVQIKLQAQRRPAPPRLELAVQCSVGDLAPGRGAGTGLANVEQRLALAHGAQAALSLEPMPGGGVRAAISMPAVP